jgi:hypothetical protein
VYVYRDTSGQPESPAAASRGPDENDPAYWYDLPGAGSASGSGSLSGTDAPPRTAGETRGPFEPLVSSAAPPDATARPEAAEPAVPDTAQPGRAPGEGRRRDAGPDDAAHAHARKLEQIKDLYLTAEAIGEANVDKHFDQLLAQQRELISEYFKQSSAARPAADSPAADSPADAESAAGAAAEQPRAW